MAEDGSRDGWFGKPYGTAVVCFILQLEGTPRLALLGEGQGLKPFNKDELQQD